MWHRRVAAAVALLVAAASRLEAHDRLRASSPRDGDTVAVAPSSIRLVFAARVDPTSAHVTLVDGARRAVPLAVATAHPDSGAVLVATVPGDVAPGTWRVEWRIAGRDGHPVTGTVRFMVEARAAGATPAWTPAAAPDADTITEAEASTFDAGAPAYVLVRWGTYLALLPLIGAFALLVVVVPRVDGDEGDMTAARVVRVGRLAAVALLAAAAARLAAQSTSLHGPAGALDPASIGSVLRYTTWGWAWIGQVAATVLALVLLSPRRATALSTRLGGGAVVIALAIASAASGHAVASEERTQLLLAADALHTVGAGAWLGALGMLLIVALAPAHRGTAHTAAAVRAFAPLALGGAFLLVASGGLLAWHHVGSLGAVVSTTYGRLVLAKAGLLVLIGTLGGVNWRRLGPRLPAEPAVRLLRRSVRGELALGALLLLVTAVLVATPTPREAAADATAAMGTDTP
ncbi:MAG: copper resistance protein CopC/CopD [Gemmatimonadaceae bacterium]|jgi:putative copper export protein/methionine-rich copper-binding protein CopC|nr:copper resistance protein CopC/CopD [Gemmatimonadaceae bacterium]